MVLLLKKGAVLLQEMPSIIVDIRNQHIYYIVPKLQQVIGLLLNDKLNTLYLNELMQETITLSK